MSLRARLIAGMVVIAAVLGVAAVAIARTTERHLVNQVDETLQSANPGLVGVGNGPGPLADHRFSALYVGMLTADGRIVTLAVPDLRDDAPLPVIDPSEARSSAESGQPFSVESTDAELRYRVLARTGGRGGRGVLVVLALPLGDVDAAVDRLVVVELATTAAVLLILGLVTWWVIRLGVRPVRQMTEAAGAIAAGNLSHRVPAATPGTEAGDLGTALNRMLGAIEETFDERAAVEDRLRQFVADASHELRTPITTIRGYAELHRTGGLNDPAERDAAMQRTEHEATRMGNLVEDLLQLARLDQGRPLERAPVDLGALVADAATDARIVAPDRAIEVSVEGSAVITGDKERLRQVVVNLVGNALVHTPAGTPIAVRLDGTGESVLIKVIDEGPGMSEAVAARAFERFYRADPSRSRARGGSGLGLAIARSVVVAHSGTITLDTVPGRGTTVRVQLPRDRAGGGGSR